MGAIRFSKYHSRLMVLLKKLDLKKYLIDDIPEDTMQFIYSPTFNYDNNIDIKNIILQLFNISKNFSTKQLLKYNFEKFCKDIFQNNYILFKKIIACMLIKIRAVYRNDTKHPAHKKTNCKSKKNKKNKINTKTYKSFYNNPINKSIFKQNTLVALQMLYTLINKKFNKYYKISTGNGTICNKLLQIFLNNNGNILYNTEFIDYEYKSNEFTIKYKCNNKIMYIKSKLLILAIPDINLKKINRLKLLNQYLKYKTKHRLCFIYTIYPNDSNTNKVWFYDIPWIYTNNALRNIMPYDKNTGIIVYYFTVTDKILKLINKSNDNTLYKNFIEKNLKILFPNTNIPQPKKLYVKFWDNLYIGWENEKSFCKFHKNILFPIKNVPIFITNESYSFKGGWIEGALEMADEIINNIKKNY